MSPILKGIYIKSLIFSLYLILPSISFAASGDYIEIIDKNGSSVMHRINYYRGKQVTSIDYNETYRVNKMRQDAYEAYLRANPPVRTPTGVMTQNTVPANISRYVPKKTVTNAVYNAAKTVGKGAFKLVNPIGKLGLAYDAWKLVDELAKAQGFNWNDDKGEWVKQVDNKVYKIVIMNDANFNNANTYTEQSFENWCNGPHSGLYSFMGMGTAGGSRTCETVGYVQGSQNVSAALKAACQSIGGDGSMNLHNVCIKQNVLLNRAVYAVAIGNEIPFQRSDFEEVAEAAANAAVAKWIAAGQLNDSDFSAPEVMVLDGEKAITPPYTDPATGKAVQAEYEFHDTTDPTTGKPTTGVTEKIKERPDLTPNSPEAPKPNPKKTPDEGGETGTGTGTGNDKPPPEQSDLCKEHPDILACDKQPGAEKEKDLPEIPKEEINIRFQIDNVFPNSGTCPQPVSFQAFGNSFAFSLQPACDLAVMIRPLIIALAWVIAAFFVVKTILAEA
ncbi:IgG-binding virulence factor TspB family protein [Kingella negevensis]|uniref:IgG-binding virulence factor TspB family protein n=1 Tax=Kingella negevensis TaxID=1522312 RepID=UPI00050A2E75|nr:IgG-binding virulence factor TspB family protein [Kingella negevensis]